jgi:hypothetical protein
LDRRASLFVQRPLALVANDGGSRACLAICLFATLPVEPVTCSVLNGIPHHSPLTTHHWQLGAQHVHGAIQDRADMAGTRSRRLENMRIIGTRYRETS